ncbi:MAG TPA: cytochrome P450 [Solirubrobacteraceae bacterium]|nr:cytochrome P450 [Solirubrobacteraceae bacterium]
MASTLTTTQPIDLGHDPARGLPPRVPLPAIAQTLAWALAPTALMDFCARRCGEAFTITFAPSGRRLTMVSDPAAVKELLTAPPEAAPSATGDTPIAAVLGPSSVITLTGPEHMRQRKLLLPQFHGERMRAYEQTIVAATERDMARWPLAVPMTFSAHTRAITLEVIQRAVFGVGDEVGGLKDAIRQLAEPVRALTMIRFALSQRFDRPAGALGEALDRLDGLIHEEIARRREQPDLAERQDILSLLLLARDEQGQGMTDGELRDELVSLLLAGHETTATSTAWAIERLVRHPAKLARLIEEIDGGESEEYMQAVIHETLRTRPVVPGVVRLLKEPMRIGGYDLPAGTRVVASIYLTNNNPRVYEQPREFRPERFLHSAPDTFAWIPFGGGIRRCIGASFAMLEMKLMLRTMLAELAPSMPRRSVWRRGEWNRRRAITLVPAAGARVVWNRR